MNIADLESQIVALLIVGLVLNIELHAAMLSKLRRAVKTSDTNGSWPLK